MSIEIAPARANPDGPPTVPAANRAGIRNRRARRLSTCSRAVCTVLGQSWSRAE